MFSITQKTVDYMNIVLTHECNKACPFCVDKYRGNGEMISTGDVLLALHKAKETGVKDILLTGGEPTLHPKVLEIANMVKSFGFRLILTTNYTNPQTVEQLDGIVDCFNVSFYDQDILPYQKDFKSDLTLHTLIHKGQLATQKELDWFIRCHQHNGHLKFSTLTNCNKWTMDFQEVGYLDSLECEWVVLFNEMLGQLYKGVIIKRYDKVFTESSDQSLKCHTDGSITKTWDRS